MVLDLDSNLGSLNPQLVLSLRLSLEFSEGRGPTAHRAALARGGTLASPPTPICVTTMESPKRKVRGSWIVLSP